MSKKNTYTEENKIKSLVKNSNESRNSKTGYMEAGNREKFKRQG